MLARVRRHRRSLSCVGLLMLITVPFYLAGGELTFSKQEPIYVSNDRISLKRTDDSAEVERVRRLIQTRDGPFINVSNTAPVGSAEGLPQNILDLLKDKTRGYFLEFGSGLQQEGTEWLEEARAWDGLIVEPDLTRYMVLRARRRRAQLLNACIEVQSTAWCGDEVSDSDLPVVSLRSLLSATRRPAIDLLVVDVSDTREQFLQTFPFQLVPISMVSVGYPGTNPNTTSLCSIMNRHGFTVKNMMVNHVQEITRIFFIME